MNMDIDSEFKIIYAEMSDLMNKEADLDMLKDYVEQGYSFIDSESEIDFTDELEIYLYEDIEETVDDEDIDVITILDDVLYDLNIEEALSN
jgi:hypothetical protein